MRQEREKERTSIPRVTLKWEEAGENGHASVTKEVNRKPALGSRNGRRSTRSVRAPRTRGRRQAERRARFAGARCGCRRIGGSSAARTKCEQVAHSSKQPISELQTYPASPTYPPEKLGMLSRQCSHMRGLAAPLPPPALPGHKHAHGRGPPSIHTASNTVAAQRHHDHHRHSRVHGHCTRLLAVSLQLDARNAMRKDAGGRPTARCQLGRGTLPPPPQPAAPQEPANPTVCASGGGHPTARRQFGSGSQPRPPPPAAPHQPAHPTVCAGGSGHPTARLQFGSGTLTPRPSPAASHQFARLTVCAGGGGHPTARSWTRPQHPAATATARCPTPARPPDRARQRPRTSDSTASIRQRHSATTATARCPTPARPPDRVRRWRRPPDRTASAWQRLFCHERHRPLPHISTPARPCAPAAAAAAPRHHSFSLAAARCSSRHSSLPQHKDAGPTVRLSYDCHPAPPPQDDNGTLPPPPPPGAPHQPARPTIFAGGGRPPASTASVRQRHSATTETTRYPRPVSLRDRVRWRRRPADSAVLAPATALCPHGRRSPRRTSTPVRSCAPAAATRQHGVAAPATAQRCRRSICRWLPHAPAQRPPPISKGVDTASSP